MFLSKVVKTGAVLTILSAVVLVGCDGSGRLVTEVSPKDAGIVSRDVVQDRYPAGTNVTLSAQPAYGYRFKEWQGAISGNTSTINVATTGNMKVRAVFEEIPKFRLVTNVSPSEGGTVTRDVHEDVYFEGTGVTLSAEPAPGYMFVKWQGAVIGNNRSIDAHIVNDMEVTALFERNTFTDSRDRKTYRMVAIGGQVWMAENLNFATNNGSWCYDNNPTNCNTYGRLYDWNTAQTVCPSGWRLPDNNDWAMLEGAVGGSSIAGMALRAKSGWRNRENGTDEFGFSALPGGHWRRTHNFTGIGEYANWWTARAQIRIMGAHHRRALNSFNSIPSDRFAVRCVRN